MPRTYQRKRPRPTYTVDNVIQAVQDVKDGKLNQRAAAVKYGVPKTIIQEHVSGRHKSLSDEELDIEACILARAHFGYPCDRRELLDLVGKYVKANKLKTQFTDGTPGEDWFLAFMKRHPRLSLKKPKHLQKLRKDATNPYVVYNFFDKLESVYKEKELTGQEKACFIFNPDESSFCSNPSRVRGIGEKGKTLSRVLSGGSGRESRIVLACVSADGYVLPPMVVLWVLQYRHGGTSENAYPGTLYSTSTKWLDGGATILQLALCLLHPTRNKTL
ncbi:hypothetical protein PR048_011700 [Dryococelus australis]|uniref:HTH psq-type domain-containing protein n=1 Tax=Dryococelus australis TaxID=614101 RepID=A0ABQ9HMM3_9NEOP|nr:hypothetical protein PR048_011700 [Dryococelus australis]